MRARFPREPKPKTVTPRELSVLFHQPAVSAMIQLVPRLCALTSLPFRHVVVLYTIHSSEIDISIVDIAEKTTITLNHVRSAVESLTKRGLIENHAPAGAERGYYRTTASAIRQLNMGLARTVNEG